MPKEEWHPRSIVCDLRLGKTRGGPYRPHPTHTHTHKKTVSSWKEVGPKSLRVDAGSSLEWAFNAGDVHMAH